MGKLAGIIFCLCATSLFFFPIPLSGSFANANTKMIMAVIGIFIFIYNISTSPNLYSGRVINRFIVWIGLAFGFSCATYLSLVVNNTSDYTYATYVISMMVWTSAAYVVVKLIQCIHGYVDVKLIILYLMGVCALQCILATSIDLNDSVREFVDRYYLDADFFHKKGRMYGFGCGLDVAGGRFAAVLVMISYLMYNYMKSVNWSQIALYITCFIIIAVIGNMIGRTTTVGMVLGVIVILFSLMKNSGKTCYYSTIIGFIVVFSIVAVILYNTNAQWQKNLEFGFEGFFSLVEKGKWEVHSNEMLKEGFIYPENIKTWLIGDGYFDEPISTDPYYIGRSFYGYYMGTDAGYSRFLFYFGLVGLLAFSAFLAKTCQICAETLPRYKYMFWTILLLNFIIWVKVSTDIYVAMAPFICLSFMELYRGHVREPWTQNQGNECYD